MSQLANILHRSEGMISFQVDDVEIGPTLVPTRSARSQLEERFKTPLLLFSHDDSFQGIQTAIDHPLVTAVHLAFSEHRPLVLTPDSIWMTISQGFAQHINNNADSLRSHFVKHSGKIKLKATIEDTTVRQQWEDAIDVWTNKIRQHIGEEVYSLMVCDFSTTTPTIRTASHIVMMDAFREYFDYILYGICGIPWVELRGTPKDWHDIRSRIQAMSQYDLQWWCDRLLPLCDAFVATAEGQPPLEFWQKIYKPREVYGGDVITGWIADLFPYIQDSITKAPTVRNPILSIPREQLTVDRGIPSRVFPNGLARAPFTLQVGKAKSALELIAGFIGITQNPHNGCLQPEIGWSAREPDTFSKLLAQLQGKEHKLQSPIKDLSRVKPLIQMPKEFVQLLENFDGGTLFSESEHPWKIRALRNYTRYEKLGVCLSFHGFMDLKDDRCIAFGYTSRIVNQHLKTRYEWWVIVGQPVVQGQDLFGRDINAFKPEETRVIATSIAQLFDRILQAEGRYYFDEPEFVPERSLF